jgi:hypothetical protein
VRTVARFWFTTKTLGEAQDILGPAGCGPDVATVEEVPELRDVEVSVTLEATDPRLPILRQLLKQYEGEDPLEGQVDEHTEEELDSARLLVMSPYREVTVYGGVELGMTYDLSGACPACGTGARQTSAVFVDGKELAKLEGRRASGTNFFHILVDERLAEDLENLGAAGLSFRGVYAVMPDKRQVKLRWRQLCAARTLPPMSPRTTGLTRERACKVCWRNGYFNSGDTPTRMVYRAADLRDADDVNLTWENVGYAILEPDLRDSLLSYPWMLVTPKVRRVFLAAGVTYFGWHPIRVEETKGG